MVNILEENIRNKLLNDSLGNDFLDLTLKAKAREKKFFLIGLQQSKQLLHGKGSHEENKKAAYRMTENSCRSYIW